MTTDCTLNASNIDGIDMPCSVPAIGREFKFPLDIELSKIPEVIDNPSESIVTYMRWLHRDVPFSQAFLAYLVEERCLFLRERINEKRHLSHPLLSLLKCGRISLSVVNKLLLIFLL